MGERKKKKRAVDGEARVRNCASGLFGPVFTCRPDRVSAILLSISLMRTSRDQRRIRLYSAEYCIMCAATDVAPILDG